MKKRIFIYLLTLTSLSCSNPKPTIISARIFTKVYPSKRYKVIGTLINNRKSGLWTIYDSLGKVESEETFVDGKSFGEAKLYENGNLVSAMKDTIIKKDTNRTYQRYNADGKVVENGQYINGIKKGIWTYFKEDGIKIKLKIDYESDGKKILFKDSLAEKGDF